MLISIDEITNALQQNLLNNSVLQVVDESFLHHGYAGYDSKVGVTHIAIDLICENFKGLNRLERQRLVNSWLAIFFKLGLHAVSYKLKTPDEAKEL